MLTTTISTTKQVPVKVLSFKWFSPVSEKLQHLRCSACCKPIGSTRWGLAWTETDKHERRSMRLCKSCGIKAEQVLK